MSQNVLRVPVDGALGVWLRYSSLPRSERFEPNAWPKSQLTNADDGYYQIDLSGLDLNDGAYEYEFVIERPDPERPGQKVEFAAPHPYARELTRYA